MSHRWADRQLHLIGIGGAGMSGLALACLRLGATVSGSDQAASSYTRRLEQLGAKVTIGHEATNLPVGAEVIVSSAIAEDNRELVQARERGQSIRHRGELLAELCAEKRLIAISGTHGKTTTTAMVAWALRELGLDPAFFIGGELPASAGNEATNAAWGAGDWVVAEADESDGSFLELRPEIAVVTNIELDHHSRWGSLNELKQAFEEFVKPAGSVVVGPQAAISHPNSLAFDASSPGPEDLKLQVPGLHNLENARAALAAITVAGIDPVEAAGALAGFPGVKRRLEYKGTRNGAAVYDDYAHHPTEVRAALTALRGLEPRRLIAIFQPHLYSRTRALADGFGAALTLADEIGVLDVYPAREQPIGPLAGVSGISVARAAADRADGRQVWWLVDSESAYEAFAPRLQEGDIVVTLGAGDITLLADRLAA